MCELELPFDAKCDSEGAPEETAWKWNLALEIQGSLELDVLLALESVSGPQKDLALFPFPFPISSVLERESSAR